MSAQQELAAAEHNLKQAKAAAREEQIRQYQAALATAIARGQELKEEYDQVAGVYLAARAEVERLEPLLRSLSERAALLRSKEPYATQQLPSKADQARWERDTKQVEDKFSLLQAQANEQVDIRERTRLAAVKAEQALNNQAQVTRNLQERLEDPEGERMRFGDVRGGLFEPFTGTRIM